MPNPNNEVHELASDFLNLMPLFRNTVFKPLEKAMNNSLSPMQFHVLVHLHHKGTLTMSELASETSTLKQQLTPITDKLAELNYVERVHDKKDRRSVKISITQAGLDFIEEHKRKGMELVMSKLGNLPSEDVKKFHDAIKTISQIVEKLQ
jgi:DNA-binding MarR family transcriptional regulator